MKDKQFNMRLSDDDQELLNNLSQKLHLPYSKIIILALHGLQYITEVEFTCHKFSDNMTIWENAELMRLLNMWKKIL